ncbi:MAG: hypothetical protein HY362_03185 [Candidatus Aenigmarchaeota archaeon]|nr:hypothetical protein [Candidatus Aenigmarchaeota archaeon]
MTNIAAFTFTVPTTNARAKHAVVVADDLANGSDHKYNGRQKLYHCGGSLVVSSGSVDYIQELLNNPVYFSKGMSPYFSAVAIARGEASKKRDLHCTLIIVGNNFHNGDPEIYKIELRKSSGVDFSGPLEYTCGGSAKTHVLPAMEEDFADKEFSIDNLTKAVAYAWSLGLVGNRDLHASDRLQVGVVSEDVKRTIYHPSVSMDAKDELDFLRLNTGLNIKNVEYSTNGTFLDLMGSLYNIFDHFSLRMMQRYVDHIRVDNVKPYRWIVRSNIMASQNPIIRVSLSNVTHQRRSSIGRAKYLLQPAVDAWYNGDVPAIAREVSRFHRNEIRKVDGVMGVWRAFPRPGFPHGLKGSRAWKRR